MDSKWPYTTQELIDFIKSDAFMKVRATDKMREIVKKIIIEEKTYAQASRELKKSCPYVRAIFINILRRIKTGWELGKF